MGPKRVLQVFASLDRGGAEQLVLEWYKQVDRSQVQFDFVAYDRETPYALEETLRSMGAQIYKIPYPWGPKFLDSVQSWRKLLRDHPEWNVVHAHYTATAPLVFGIGRKQGRRCIAHGHASNRSLQWPLHLGGFLLANRNLACSEESRRHLFGPIDADVFPNAVDTRVFAYRRSAAEEILSETKISGDPLFGHVGRFSREKNHALLLDIFVEILKEIPTANLILAGQGALEDAMKQKAAELGITKQVYFLGMRTDIPRILSALDLLIMPSLFEGMPITMLEAQANGLPCLVSDVISEDSIIPEVGNVEMMPLSAPPKAWARKAVEMVEASRGVNREQAAQSIVGTPYDIATSAKRLLEVYEL